MNKGIIVGQEVSDQTLKTISQKIGQKIKPEVTPKVKVLEIGGKKIIEVKVKEGWNKPYYLEKIHRDSFCKQKRDVQVRIGLNKKCGEKEGEILCVGLDLSDIYRTFKPLKSTEVYLKHGLPEPRFEEYQGFRVELFFCFQTNCNKRP